MFALLRIGFGNLLIFITSRRFAASSGKNRLVARVSIPSSDILGVTAKVCGLLGLKMLF